MKDFIPCRKCLKENKEDPTVPLGYHKVSDESGFFTALMECDCHKKYRLSNTLRSSLARRGFNPTIVDYVIKSYKGDKSLATVERLKKFSEIFDVYTEEKIKEVYSGPIIVYMYGPYGTQKTTLANWLGKTFTEKGKKCYFTLMNDLVKLLQRVDGFDANPEDRAKYERYIESDILFIDESFDKEKMTIYKSGYQIPFLDSFLRKRLTMGLATIFISNVAPEDIDISPAIKDLILRNIHKQNTSLLFEDNYDALRGEYDTSVGLF